MYDQQVRTIPRVELGDAVQIEDGCGSGLREGGRGGRKGAGENIVPRDKNGVSLQASTIHPVPSLLSSDANAHAPACEV